MNVEQMTNEELANWMVPFTAIDDRSSGYIKSIIDEAARRLRTSIPKPVVEVVEGTGWWWSMNGSKNRGKVFLGQREIGWLFVEPPITPDHMDAMCNAWNALGMEGGGE